MNETRFDYEQAQQGIAAGATVVTVNVTVPVGERWQIVHAQGQHTDPANPVCYWYLTRGGATRILGTAATLTLNVALQLYDVAKCPEDLILGPGDILGLVAASMAAGKNWTMQLFYEIRRGEV
jgi:hypothetical protein